MKKLIPLLLLASCTSNVQVEQPSKVDSLLQKSQKLNDSSIVVLKIADKKTEEVVKQVAKKVDDMRGEIKSLKETIKVTKSTVIRDTIFVTEKKNFWGKTKKTIDSTSKDSTEYEKNF